MNGGDTLHPPEALQFNLVQFSTEAIGHLVVEDPSGGAWAKEEPLHPVEAFVALEHCYLI